MSVLLMPRRSRSTTRRSHPATRPERPTALPGARDRRAATLLIRGGQGRSADDVVQSADMACGLLSAVVLLVLAAIAVL